MNKFLLAVVAIMVLLVVGKLGQGWLNAQALVPYASDADAVGLPDGRKLAFTCMGEGSPTVILTPGMGEMAAMAWGQVQDEMAETTRVCAWDRPGFGLSDGSPQPQTVATTTNDLAAALGTGAIPGPYVMVGHSLGGYESLLYADLEKENVVGMVLVDSSFPGQHLVADRIFGGGPNAQDFAMIQTMHNCAEDIRAGRSKLGGPDPRKCFTYPDFFPRQLRQALGQKVSNPIQYQTMASFIGSFQEDSALAVNPNRDYGTMPLTVLSSTVLPPLPAGALASAANRAAAFHAEFDRAHERLATLSTRGVHQRVEGADHYIQRTQPQAVIDAVAQVVVQARADMR